MRRSFNLTPIVLLVVVLLLAAPLTALAQEGEHDEPAVVEEEHAEEGGGGIGALGINLGFLIAQIVNFLLIAGLLTVILWRPVVNMLDARAAKIEKGLEDAAAAANARMNAETEAEKILAQARVEAAHLLEEARQRGEEVAKTIKAEARADADKIRADAHASAETERNAQLADMRGQIAAIAVAVSERLIGETLTEKRQQALIDDFFAKVPAEAKSLKGHIEVVSAMPLTDAEQSKVKGEIGADEVTFRVDPAILGGLIIRSGEKVVDGSVSNNLGSLASRLQ